MSNHISRKKFISAAVLAASGLPLGLNVFGKADEEVKKAGLKIHMITTAIKDARDPNTEAIIKTASLLGIKYYRTAWYNYDKTKNIPTNLNDIRNRFSDLAVINKQYGIHGSY